MLAQSFNVIVNEEFIKLIGPSAAIESDGPSTTLRATTLVATTTAPVEASGFDELEPNPPPFEINLTSAAPRPQPIPVKGIGFFGYDLSLFSSESGSR